ncbi:uncharacterized protein LOC125845770 [Solanum stenotomum]|uniref:uncharacterized protein LOC125845770 n=1 Tax=Solanum stenotomum TaxID=172797 RepID=UPI0020D1C5DC|nr:uncharacterized protein LOC125845770 [Solanum stenotomum]
MKPPTFHEVRVTHLKKEVEKVEKIVDEHKVQWTKFGCSIMMDKWKAPNGKMIINILVNSPIGSVFLGSVDASNESTDSIKIYKLFESTIERIGPRNIVQIVTDNASENVKAGSMMMGVYPHIYWTPCAIHCINLMFGDIFKVNPYASVFIKAIKIHSYISKAIDDELDEKIHQGKKFGETGQDKICNCQFNFESYFWSDVVRALTICGRGLLTTVLHLVDGEKKPPMVYIYEAMNRAKETTARGFHGVKKQYEKVFEIIDARWSDQLHPPLHVVGHVLNPGLFYKAQEEETLLTTLWDEY